MESRAINMKRYLLRGAQGPFDNFSAFETYKGDKIWSNVGNLLFSNSVYKNLYSDDTQITMYTKNQATDADYINENYDAYLIPLANAFRKSYREKLIETTKLVKALKIPCIVIGVGLQSDINSPSNSYPFDEEVKQFMSAILEKSSCVGVRGEVTEKYLKGLGFNDVRVIGCPSMYYWGNKLPDNSSDANQSLFKISINGKNNDNDEVKKYLFNSGYDYVFIPQTTHELKMMLSGSGSKEKSKNYYPDSLQNKAYLENRVKFCLNMNSWINLLKSRDMSIGTRIHGNIAAVLAGIPAYIIASDSRVAELAEYHEIPYCEMNKFDFSQDIYSLYQKTDFKKIYTNHQERYDTFRSFMKENGLDIVDQPNRSFDSKLEKVSVSLPVDSILHQKPEDIARYLTLYNGHAEKVFKKMKKDIDEFKLLSLK